jgi:hypothetical protein
MKNGHAADCGAYAAVQELHDETAEHCPGDPTESDQSSTFTSTYTNSVVVPTNPRVFKNWAVKHTCQRASPLTCVNQALALELNVLARSRELESLSPNALSYEKSVGVRPSISQSKEKLMFFVCVEIDHKMQVISCFCCTSNLTDKDSLSTPHHARNVRERHQEITWFRE